MLEGEAFVPNDLLLDRQARQLLILTGPNMAGKSTVLRQAALIVLMAQAGSFVPARSARVGRCDRIFTRVGASDNLSQGQSTFMVEMSETAQILSQATARSLVVLDEIGRGTSTFDGLSIAWAVAEDLHDRIGARTLFATHYHELQDLARDRPRVRSASMLAREVDGRVVFLRKVAEGAEGRSFGIEVARLAGLPEGVLRRAREILQNLESGELDEAGHPTLAKAGRRAAQPVRQLTLFGAEPSEIEREIAGRDLGSLTPLEALNLLAAWQAKLRGA
jgi:DNA mismatch repair protein MutS